MYSYRKLKPVFYLSNMTFSMKLFSFFLLTLLACAENVQAQNIESTLEKFGEKYEAEKAYVHYDKPAYSAGETIWFKAYLMQGAFPAEITKTFYLDWLDEKGNLLFHSVLPVLESSAVGQFDIPENFKGGLIHVRGYTRWMLNFDTAFLYNKDLRILSSTKSTGVAEKPVASLAFFAEGGDAIEGIANKIAFKANDQWGRPVKIKGVVEAANGHLIDSFHSVHDGMGSFYFLPAAGTKYTAKWKDEKGQQHSTALPVAKSSGINLHAGKEAGNTFFALTRSENATDNLKEGFVLGTMQQHLVFKTGFDLKKVTNIKKVIPVSQLPTGILTITVFDKDANPVAERILFINNHDYSFTPVVDVQHWGLNKRAKNEIQVSVPDSLVANLSIAVTDAAIGADSSENIFSTLLLTSEIRGIVHNPAYYFSSASDSAEKYLDLVMLTNGWRRFNWNDLMKGKLPSITYPKDTAYLALSGAVNGVLPGTAGDGSLVMIVKQKDSSSKMIVTPLDAMGRFIEPDFIFFDTMTVYHQLPKSSMYKNAGIDFMQDRLPAIFNNKINNFIRYNPAFTDTTGSGYNYSRALEKLATVEFFKSKTLENVTVRAKTKSPIEVLDEKYASGLFSGGDSYNFDLVNDPLAGSYQNIFSYLQGKVAGLQITTSGGGTSLQWRGGTPQVYLDEMPTDVEMLSSMSVNDIAYVKVFRPPFMGGAGGGSGGAIAIYMRKGGDFQTSSKGLDRNTVIGYTEIREFYSPNYIAIDRKNEQRDLRTTLYWKPILLTAPGKSKILISFFNNDVTESFRVIIEGITKDGRLAHIEQVLE